MKKCKNFIPLTHTITLIAMKWKILSIQQYNNNHKKGKYTDSAALYKKVYWGYYN